MKYAIVVLACILWWAFRKVVSRDFSQSGSGARQGN